MLPLSRCLALVALVAVVSDAQFGPQPMQQPISCYACLSGTLSDSSRAVFQQGVDPVGRSFDVCEGSPRFLGVEKWRFNGIADHIRAANF